MSRSPRFAESAPEPVTGHVVSGIWEPQHVSHWSADSDEVKRSGPIYELGISSSSKLKLAGGGEKTVHSKRSDNGERRICGMRLVTLFLLIALTTLIIAIAIVGGIGNSISQHKDHELAAAHHELSKLRQQGTPTKHSNALNADATTTVTAAPSPTSNCQDHPNENWHSDTTGLDYTRICGSYLDLNQPHEIYFQSVQQSFTDCLLACDSYNAWRGTSNVTSINFNVSGEGDPAPGMCWCTNSAESRVLGAEGWDSAYLAGTFVSDL